MSEFTMAGKVTKGPELRRTMAGTPVCRFHLVEEDAECPGGNPLRLDVIAWGPLASISASVLAGGARVEVSGRLGLREVRRGGRASRAYSVIARSVRPLGQDGATVPVVHCKRDPYDIYIGRGRDPRSGEPGRWGNPFSHRPSGQAVTRVATRAEAIERYRAWLWEQIKAGRVDLDELAALDGKTLGCWCAPEPCHGEVLAAAASWAAARKS
ncbi:MAG TPA: DUF4326 domain-containing protein [Solirubrobacterales bacterium]|nr:DUF4326 domain-containing protein [Solirubrobacterales bacterium]